MSGLIRYAPRHFADLLMTRGLGIIAIGFLFVFPVYLGGRFGEDPAEHAQMVRLFGELLTQLGLFFTLLASYGLAGADRRQGFYRFMFAKPISPVRYYALSYLLTTIVFLLGLLATVGIWAVLISPTWPAAQLGDIIADYFLLSAVILVLSPLTNGDWVIGLLALLLAQGLRMSYPKDESAVGAVLNAILPPTDTGRLFMLDGTVNWGPLAWQLGYALLVFVLALVVIRKMPMGSAS